MSRNNVKVCAVANTKVLDKLTGNGEVVCARCGARAHKKANVCEPVVLEPDH